MNAFWDTIGKALKNGFKTSEFFIAALALLLPLVEKIVDPVVDRFDPATFVGGLIAAVYVFVRGWVKSKAAGEIIKNSPIERVVGLLSLEGGETVPTPSGWAGHSSGIPEYRPGWVPPPNPIPGVDTPPPPPPPGNSGTI